MRFLLIIGLVFWCSVSGFAQSRNNMIYSDFIKFPNSFYWLSLGWDHTVKLTRKSYTAGRVYFVLSPNILWSGYNFTSLKNQSLNDQLYPKTNFDQYQLVLPAHLRFEISPNRIVLGSKPGKHNNDVAIFFDVGISFNYLLSAHLHEDFSNNGYPFAFDGAITSTAANRATMQFLPFSLGIRVIRFVFFVRYYQPFARTRYTDLSKNWGLPTGVHSYFYNQWLATPSNQATALVCLGYTF